ncbi:MAG TPA: YihY/virulence factor BrkB family protein [Gammaproteobacteria bacterium]|nr:YihY/virulence factor BrkB family protein [Gammaproteobacteria bacterium]
MDELKKLKQRAIDFLWGGDPASMPFWRGRLIMLLRVVWVAIRDLADGQLTLRAMSLVYTSLLSLVPLLAVSFSVLKAFGVHNQIEPLLLQFLAPLGEKGTELSSRIIEFVENVRAGVLGSVGLAFLLYTVIALIQKVESAFNYTWHVEQHRRFTQRFSDYLSVIIIGPVLVFTALGITATVMNTALVQRIVAIEPFGAVAEFGGRIVPYLLIIAAFTFIYVFVPNTRVRVRSALVGGLVAGVLWQTVGWAFTSFIVGSSKYTAIYSAFATLILFMIWLYLSWIILLIGASIAFYHQHPEYLSVRRRQMRLSARMQERLALMVMYLVGRNYYQGHEPWTIQGLTQRLRIPMDLLEDVLLPLQRHDLLVTSADEPPAYLPGRPLEATPVSAVLAAVRSAGEEAFFSTRRLPHEASVERVVAEFEHALHQTLGAHSVKEMVLGEGGQSAALEHAPGEAGRQAGPAGERSV